VEIKYFDFQQVFRGRGGHPVVFVPMLENSVCGGILRKKKKGEKGK
jgi:hypothetical protein